MAAAAVKLGDGYRLDKSHVLAVNFFNDIEKYAGMDETFVPPKVDKYQPKEHLKSWLSDDKARDQFVLLRGENTGIYFNNRGDKPDKDHARDVCCLALCEFKETHPYNTCLQNWTDSHVAFSPKGLFLATVHKQGIALWGGKSWAKIMRFPHPNAKFFDFSPGEKYVVTWSLEPFATKDGDKQVCPFFC